MIRQEFEKIGSVSWGGKKGRHAGLGMKTRLLILDKKDVDKCYMV